MNILDVKYSSFLRYGPLNLNGQSVSMGIFYFEMSREIHIKLGCLLHKNFLNGKTVVNKYKNKIK